MQPAGNHLITVGKQKLLALTATVANCSVSRLWYRCEKAHFLYEGCKFKNNCKCTKNTTFYVYPMKSIFETTYLSSKHAAIAFLIQYKPFSCDEAVKKQRRVSVAGMAMADEEPQS